MRRYLAAVLGGVALVLALAFFIPGLWPFGARALSSYDLSNLNALKPKLKLADVILREGVGVDSVMIKQMSQSEFSHIGLIVSTEPALVLHATTDDEPGKRDQVLLSSLEDFARLAKQIAIKRYDLSETQREQIAAAALKFKGRAFVLSPEKDGFYCTSLIESAYKGVFDLNLSKQRLEIPALSGEYLLPKAFFDDNKSKFIAGLSFGL